MRRLGIIAIVFFFGCSFNASSAQEATIERARLLLKHGAYKEAIATYSTLLQKNPADREAFDGITRAQTETGEYETAEKRLRAFLNDHATDGSARCSLGEIEFQTGRYAEAATDFEHAAKEGKGPVALQANVGRARALLAQGKDTESRAPLLEAGRYYTESQPRTAPELVLVAQAFALLEKFQDANEFYQDAREADPTYIEAFIGQGELLNRKYRYDEAPSLFQDAFKINEGSADAQAGYGASVRFSSNEVASVAVERALKVNPNHVGALVLRAWLNLEADQFDPASKSLDRALAVNPNSIQAMGVRAAIFYLADRKADLDAVIKRALAVNPHAGEVFDTLAQFAVNNRRYTDAVDYGRRAIELSPNLWSARTQLGIQLLRVGRGEEGRAELERAFKGDPFNPWAKNTLDLLDSMKDYVDTVRGPFLIKSSSKESGAFAAYAADLMEEAHKKLTSKYRFTPPAPISIEVFADHDDFAVRSLGVPGLGALGVCFGQVIAMDSPSARPPGEFNWGSTLWHEFAHVITLEVTDHRIPRWFSEGLSVYEERRARTGWGDNWSLKNLKAFTDGRFVKINDLDAAFTHPKSPDGVPLAYFQASMVCEFVEEKFGFDGILKMLASYKEGAKTPDVLQRVLKLPSDDFDRAFNEYVRSKTSAWVEAIGSGPIRAAAGQTPSKDALLAVLKARPNDYFANLRVGAMYKTEGDAEKAIEHLRRASELFPYYTGEGNPYALLSEIYDARGQKPEAASVLETLVRYNETNAGALAKLARLRLGMGDRKAAVEALKQSFYIQPFDPSLHKLAGAVYLELGNPSEAIHEFRVQIALAPPDLAEAHYDLARALEAAGNHAEARREVLRSLEIAPGFDKAQELLLKLRASRQP
ncbi:MAG: tetratricopeptide repeat protein [Acidobacteriota bacterium]